MDARRAGRLCLKLAVALLLPLLAGPAAAVDPSSIRLAPVMDLAGVITAGTEGQIENLLADLESAGLVQAAVLTLPSLEGEGIEEFSLRAARHWGLGDMAKDNGLLLVVVPGERQYRVEVGTGLAEVIPDAAAYALARENLVPAFGEGDYGEGVRRFFHALGVRLGRFQPAGGEDVPAGERAPVPLLVWAIFGVIGAFMGGSLVYAALASLKERRLARRRRESLAKLSPEERRRLKKEEKRRAKRGRKGGGRGERPFSDDDSFAGGGGSFGGGGTTGRW